MPRSTPEQRGWYLYDWANSAFATTVVTPMYKFAFACPWLFMPAKPSTSPGIKYFPVQSITRAPSRLMADLPG